MTLRETAIARAKRNEKKRVDRWGGTRQYTEWLAQAFFQATDGHQLAGISGPLAEDLIGLSPEWLTQTVVAETDDDSVRWILRIPGEGAPESVEDVEVYPLGSCPRCEGEVPFGPAVADLDQAGMTLLTGRPIGHDCLALWGQK